MGFNHHEIKTNRTQVLSEYINSARFEDFPANVVERAKQILIETIGEALASVESEAAKRRLLWRSEPAAVRMGRGPCGV